MHMDVSEATCIDIKTDINGSVVITGNGCYMHWTVQGQIYGVSVFEEMSHITWLIIAENNQCNQKVIGRIVNYIHLGGHHHVVMRQKLSQCWWPELEAIARDSLIERSPGSADDLALWSASSSIVLYLSNDLCLWITPWESARAERLSAESHWSCFSLVPKI